VRKPSLVINAISNWLGLGVSIVIGFLLTPYIIHRLGTDHYGIWALIASVIGYYGLLDLGVRSAVTRYIARYASRGDYKALGEMVNSALAMFCLVGVFVIVATVFVAGPVTRFFFVEPTDFAIFKQVFLLLGIAAGLLFPCNVLAVVLIAHERFVIANLIRGTSNIIRAILSFVVLYTGGGLVALGWINLSMAVFEILANSIVVLVCFDYIRFSRKLVKKDSMMALLGFGTVAFAGKVGDLLRLKVGTAVVGRCLDMEFVGVYALATMLFGYLYRMNAACSGVTMPRLSALAGRNDEKKFQEAVMRYSIVSSTLVCGLGLVAFVLAKDFINIWMPENFADTNGSIVVFLILVVGLLPSLMSSVFWNALQAVRKHQYYAWQALIEGLVNVTLAIVLVGPLGIYGVALAAAIPSLVARLVVQPIYCCRIIRISWRRYMLQVVLSPLILFATGAVICRYCDVYFTAKSYPMLIVKGIAVLSIYATASYAFCLDNQTKQYIRTKLFGICNAFPLYAGDDN